MKQNPNPAQATQPSTHQSFSQEPREPKSPMRDARRAFNKTLFKILEIGYQKSCPNSNNSLTSETAPDINTIVNPRDFYIFRINTRGMAVGRLAALSNCFSVNILGSILGKAACQPAQPSPASQPQARAEPDSQPGQPQPASQSTQPGHQQTRLQARQPAPLKDTMNTPWHSENA
jgi:hypothetical protein